MRGRVPFLVLAGALILGAGVLALKSSRRAHEAELGRSKASQQREAMRREIARLNQQINQAETAVVQLHRTLADVQAAGTRPPAKARPGPGAAFLPWWKEARLKDPQLQALWVESSRVGMRTRYGPFFHRAGMTSEQMATFSEAVLRHDEALLDLEATALAQGLDDGDSAIAALRKAADDQSREVQLGLLGEAGHRELEEYERTWFVPIQMTRLAGALAATGTPLTTEQGAQLTRIIVQASPSYQRGGKVDSPSDFQDETSDAAWRGPVSAPYDPAAIFGQARTVLSEQQFAFFGATMAQVMVPKIMNAVREYSLRRKGEAVKPPGN